MAEKMNLTEQINAIAFEGLTEEQFAFLKERALKSIRKPSKTKALTKTQKDNLVSKEKILTLLAEKGKLTATQIGEELGWKGSQKATALLTPMVKAGTVVRTKEGKLKLFSLPEAEVEETEEEEEEE